VRLARITMRRWMIAVAIMAAMLGGERGWRWWDALRQRADYHDGMSRTLALIREKGEFPYCSLGIEGIPLVYNSETASTHAAFVLYHARMTRKYRLAMWRPWLPVEPDRPEPSDEPSRR
jgi:hypothetical protein